MTGCRKQSRYICVPRNCARGALQVLEQGPRLGFTCGDGSPSTVPSCISSSEGSWAQRLGGALPASRKGEGRAVALTQESTPGFGTESLCGWNDQRWRVGLGRGAPELFLSTYLEGWGPTRHALPRPGGLFWGRAGVSTESAPLLPADSQAHKWVVCHIPRTWDRPGGEPHLRHSLFSPQTPDAMLTCWQERNLLCSPTRSLTLPPGMAVCQPRGRSTEMGRPGLLGLGAGEEEPMQTGPLSRLQPLTGDVNTK